jgi:hypothetical protein
MSAIGKPTTAAKDLLNLLQTVNELKSTENEEEVCHALQHYVARIKQLSDRREQQMQMMKGTDEVQPDTEPDFSASAEHDFEAAFENVRPPLLQTSVQDRKLQNEPCKPNPVSDSVRYFEIMSFKTIREEDCESEASDDTSTAFETVDSNSTHSMADSSPLGVQDSPDSPRFGLEDTPSSKNAALRKEMCDVRMLVVKAGVVEEKTQPSMRASSKKFFVKKIQDRVCKRDDETDEVDVMGMAIM